MSGDSATETTPPRRSWTVWIWRGAFLFLLLFPLIYVYALLRARQGIQLVESSGGHTRRVARFSVFDPFCLRDPYDLKYGFLQIDRDVEMVNLRRSRLRSGQLKILERFPNLKELLIDSKHLGPELKFLAAKGLPETLMIFGSPLKTEGMEDFGHLECLYLFNKSGRMDLQGLSRMPRLKKLSLTQSHPLNGEDLQALANCLHLEWINLDVQLDASGWQTLARSPSLKEIVVSLSQSPLSWSGLSALKDAPHLQRLTMECVTRDALVELQHVTQLVSLEFVSGQLALEDLKLLASLKNLRGLTLKCSMLMSEQEWRDAGRDRDQVVGSLRKQIREQLYESLSEVYIDLRDY